MGQPVLIFHENEDGSGGDWVEGPEATDNFGSVAGGFEFDGVRYFQVELAYQASKFRKGTPPFERFLQRNDDMRTAIDAGQNASALGMAAWKDGHNKQEHAEFGTRGFHDGIRKVELMYLMHAAKYSEHPELQVELLQAATAPREGGNLTRAMTGHSTTADWAVYNGVIQSLLHAHFLRLSDASSRSAFLRAQIAKYWQEKEVAPDTTLTAELLKARNDLQQRLDQLPRPRKGGAMAALAQGLGGAALLSAASRLKKVSAM